MIDDLKECIRLCVRHNNFTVSGNENSGFVAKIDTNGIKAKVEIMYIKPTQEFVVLNKDGTCSSLSFGTIHRALSEFYSDKLRVLYNYSDLAREILK